MASNDGSGPVVSICWAEDAVSSIGRARPDVSVRAVVEQWAPQLRDRICERFNYEPEIPMEDLIISVVPRGLLSFVCFAAH
jgi:hypothetical protein